MIFQDIENKVFNSDSGVLLKEYPSESIDLIITDPPYGISYSSHKQCIDMRTGKNIVNRESNYFIEIDNDSSVPVNWLDDAFRILKNGCAMYIFTHWRSYPELFIKVAKSGFKIKNMIVINKSNHGMGDLKGSFSPKHEIVIYACKGRHILNFENGRISDVIDVPVKYSGSFHYHPNEKPKQWITPFILSSSKVGDIILDPFSGSGSFLIYAKESGRRYSGIEVNKQFYDICLSRGLDGSQ